MSASLDLFEILGIISSEEQLQRIKSVIEGKIDDLNETKDFIDLKISDLQETKRESENEKTLQP